ncbi:MAG: hypothetical protein FGF51_02180 [Candidatus Brockarchaeota archaeon]|nr:hypothetical protein [Candidatus Brockarchaeota archaeon]
MIAEFKASATSTEHLKNYIMQGLRDLRWYKRLIEEYGLPPLEGVDPENLNGILYAVVYVFFDLESKKTEIGYRFLEETSPAPVVLSKHNTF